MESSHMTRMKHIGAAIATAAGVALVCSSSSAQVQPSPQAGGLPPPAQQQTTPGTQPQQQGGFAQQGGYGPQGQFGPGMGHQMGAMQGGMSGTSMHGGMRTQPGFGPSQLPTEQQIRAFFQQAEQVIGNATRSGNRAQAIQYLRASLAPDAEFWTTSDLAIGGQHVATVFANINEDILQNVLGFMASAMQGRDNVQGYTINIRVLGLEPRDNYVRVTTQISEQGQIAPGLGAQPRVAQQGQGYGPQPYAGLSPDQQGFAQQGFGSQQAFALQGQAFGQGFGGGAGGFTQGQPAFGQGYGPSGFAQQGSPVLSFQARANCVHDVLLGQQGQIQIGNSRCRGHTNLTR